MRQLDNFEAISKFQSKSSDLEYADKINYHQKSRLFWSFIQDQNRLVFLTGIIETDYAELGVLVNRYFEQHLRTTKSEIDAYLDNSDKQGAFGYFVFKYLVTTTGWANMLSKAMNMFDVGDYDETKDQINELALQPFTEYMIEMMEEREIREGEAYFSNKEVEELEQKIDDLELELDKLSIGQEIIFVELEEIKELVKILNKKNWRQTLTGKLVDLGFNNVASIGIKLIYRSLIGNELPLELGD